MGERKAPSCLGCREKKMQAGKETQINNRRFLWYEIELEMKGIGRSILARDEICEEEEAKANPREQTSDDSSSGEVLGSPRSTREGEVQRGSCELTQRHRSKGNKEENGWVFHIWLLILDNKRSRKDEGRSGSWQE
ncbi:unnamed protein product [Lactuca virosa]|uniref:Uncharacterized protein n=1 Tax=Lactuca virosa TaxID=75947 RepID=A0AAU9MM69_9ASTR|nr:unnamed protein product [Lactuca virosa]